MKSKLGNLLATLPEKRISALAVSVVALLALTLALAVYPYYLQWQRVAEARGQTELQAANHSMVKLSTDQIKKENEQLETQLAQSASSLDELVVSVMREMERVSSQYNLKLGQVSPGTASPFLMLDEIFIAVEVVGQYQDIVRWVHTIGTFSPSVSLSQLTLKNAEDNDDVILNAIVAANHYRDGK